MAMPTCSKRRRGGTINKYARLPPGYAMQLVQQNVCALVTNGRDGLLVRPARSLAQASSGDASHHHDIGGGRRIADAAHVVYAARGTGDGTYFWPPIKRDKCHHQRGRNWVNVTREVVSSKFFMCDDKIRCSMNKNRIEIGIFYGPVPSLRDWKSLLNRLRLTPTVFGDKRFRIPWLCGPFFCTVASTENGITLFISDSLFVFC